MAVASEGTPPWTSGVGLGTLWTKSALANVTLPRVVENRPLAAIIAVALPSAVNPCSNAVIDKSNQQRGRPFLDGASRLCKCSFNSAEGGATQR